VPSVIVTVSFSGGGGGWAETRGSSNNKFVMHGRFRMQPPYHAILV